MLNANYKFFIVAYLISKKAMAAHYEPPLLQDIKWKVIIDSKPSTTPCHAYSIAIYHRPPC